MGDRLHGLDGLRGIAALIVFWHHITLNRGTPGALPLGDVAVDVFFVISGFVMAHTYDARINTGKLTAIGFIAIRIKRLWPVYAVGCAIGLVALLSDSISVTIALPAFALALMFLPAPFISEKLFPVNGPGWSLSFELLANLFHAFALARLTTRQLGYLTLMLTFAFSAKIYADGHIQGGTHAYAVDHAIIRTAAMYTIGVFLCRAHAYRLAVPPFFGMVIFPFVVITAPGGVVASLALIALCPFAVIAAIRLDGTSPFLHFIGSLSYPLYAVHIPIVLLMKDQPLWLVMAISVAVALAVAFALDRHRFPIFSRRARIERI